MNSTKKTMVILGIMLAISGEYLLAMQPAAAPTQAKTYQPLTLKQTLINQAARNVQGKNDLASAFAKMLPDAHCDLLKAILERNVLSLEEKLEAVDTYCPNEKLKLSLTIHEKNVPVEKKQQLLEAFIKGASDEKIKNNLTQLIAYLNQTEFPTPLAYAISRSKPELIKFLLDIGENPSQTFKMQIGRHHWQTLNPLSAIVASQYYNPEVAQALLDAGARVNDETLSLDEQPLNLALVNNNEDYVKRLIKAGANPNKKFNIPFRRTTGTINESFRELEENIERAGYLVGVDLAEVRRNLTLWQKYVKDAEPQL
jgi:hypothetical protein